MTDYCEWRQAAHAFTLYERIRPNGKMWNASCLVYHWVVLATGHKMRQPSLTNRKGAGTYLHWWQVMTSNVGWHFDGLLVGNGDTSCLHSFRMLCVRLVFLCFFFCLCFHFKIIKSYRFISSPHGALEKENGNSQWWMRSIPLRTNGTPQTWQKKGNKQNNWSAATEPTPASGSQNKNKTQNNKPIQSTADSFEYTYTRTQHASEDAIAGEP